MGLNWAPGKWPNQELVLLRLGDKWASEIEFGATLGAEV